MIEIKKLPKSQIEVHVEVPWSEWKRSIGPAVEKLAQHVKVEGFRPGKAPREMIEQQIGKESILSEASEQVIAKSWERVVKEEKIQAIGRPQAEVLVLAEGNDLKYAIVTTVMPEVELSKKWKDAVKKTNEKSSQEKRDNGDDVQKEVEKELQRLVESRAELVKVERVAQEGDAVEVDFQVTVDGVPIEGGSAKNHALVLGSHVFIPGFEEEIVGMSPGEEKTFELKFPKDYHEKNLAGKKATFQTQLKLVQERDIPKITDDFVVSLGSFKNVQELKKNITEGIEKEKEEKLQQEKRTQIVEELLKHVEAELPDLLVEEEMEMMIRDFEGRVTSMGMPFDQYLLQMKKTREEMRDSFRDPAEKRVRINLAFAEIADKESLAPESEAVQERMNIILSQYKGEKDIEKKIDMRRLFAMSRGELMNEAVWKLLETL